MQPEAARVELDALSAAFIASHGRRPTQADIAADVQWGALFDSLRAAERAAAPPQREGGCSVFIARRRRYCSHAAAAGGGGLCSAHEEDAAAAATPQLPSRVASPEPASTKPGWALKRNLKRRMKACSNPCAVQFHPADPAAALPTDWGALLGPDAAVPVLLDLGCAKGRWLGRLATCGEFERRWGRHSLLGVELFAPLVAAANAWRDAAGLAGRLHYVAGHAARLLPPLAASLAASGRSLGVVCVQFPDPWQEDNAAKRLVSPEFASALAAAMPRGALLYVASDVVWLADEIRCRVLATEAFAPHALHGGGGGSVVGCEGGAAAAAVPWLAARPFGVPTERDLVCEGAGAGKGAGEGVVGLGLLALLLVPLDRQPSPAPDTPAPRQPSGGRRTERCSCARARALL